MHIKNENSYEYSDKIWESKRYEGREKNSDST